jgi:TolB-like protein
MRLPIAGVVALLITVAGNAAARNSVAVVNFSNSSASRSLDYLKTALPESVSGTLSSSREITVLERNELKQVLKEIELEQSGAVDSGQVARAGKLLRADVLLMGSFSGDAERINVTLRAVDVTSGAVIEGRSVSASLATILDEAGKAALAMASAIAGGKSGRLTVTSSPEGAEVLIDGIVIGTTPVVEYRLSAGSHSVFVRKPGYESAERNATIRPGETERLSETLAPAREAIQVFVGAGYARLFPMDSTLKQGNLFMGQLGITFGRWTADFSYGLTTGWDHSYSYSSPFGALSQSREYTLNSYLLGIALEPFTINPYISPYVGVFGGYARVSDYRLKGSDETKEKLASFDLLQLGIKAGVELFPKLKVSLFLEARYNAFTKSVTRGTYVSQGILGEPLSVSSELSLTNISFGGGARLNF